MKVNEAIFRDYDIRGLVDEDLNVEFAEVFGKAYGTFLAKNNIVETFVGHDARESSSAYYEATIRGLLATGTNVIKIGMVTSPMLYWARKFYNKNGGVAITASHNPPEYNGFKPCFGNGAMFGQGLQDLKKLMMSEEFTQGRGSVTKQEILEDYYKDIQSKVKIAKKLKIIVDCGNATAGPIAPEIFRRLSCDVVELFCDLDPTFPNHPPDPVDARAYPQIVEMIKGGGFDAGLVFDGDADRLGIVDESGNIVRGDQITALCARKILMDKPGALVDFELQCSKSATDDVVNHGGKFKLIRVGHSYIEEALLNDKAELAGETSGHVFFADRWYGFDDAIYAACRFLEYLSESGKTVKALIDSMPVYISTPATRIFAPDDRKFEIVKELQDYFRKRFDLADTQARSNLEPKLITIDGIRLEWPDGWAVVRASNTMPQLTLRAEATSETRLEELKKFVEETMSKYEKDGVKIEWGKVH